MSATCCVVVTRQTIGSVMREEHLGVCGAVPERTRRVAQRILPRVSVSPDVRGPSEDEGEDDEERHEAASPKAHSRGHQSMRWPYEYTGIVVSFDRRWSSGRLNQS